MNTAGFYKLIENTLHWGANAVLAPDYTLVKEEYETYTYPIDGWYWFESEEEARVFFNFYSDLPENT